MGFARLDSRDRRNLLIILGVLGMIYGALISNHWFRGTDTAYYLGIARSMITGHGYEFNGSRVGSAPPGWPMVLSLLMKVSPSFLFLNTANTLILCYSMVCSYFVLRRFLDPKKALWTTLISSILYWNYTSGIHLRTEAIFNAVFFQTVLFSLQLSEGKRGRLPLILLGCALMPLIRYAAIAAWILVAAAIMHGKSFNLKATREEYKAFWKSIMLVCVTLVVLAVSFVGTRDVLLKKILPRYFVPRQTTSKVTLAVKNMDISDRDEGGAPSMQAVLGSSSSYLVQGLSAGQWAAGNFWMPAQAFNSNKFTALAVNLFGWLVIAMMIPPAIRQCKGGSYLLAGALLYSGLIVTRWASIKTRYLMPVSPFLLAALWAGLEIIVRKPSVQRVLVRVFFGSVLLANLAPWGYDVFIARSGDKFNQYSDAGELDELVSAAHYLRSIGVRDGEVAVNHYITSSVANKRLSNGYALRGLFMLLDKSVNIVPNAPSTTTPNKKNPKTQPATPENLPPEKWNLERWQAELKEGKITNPNLVTYCKLRGIRYYLYRPPETTHIWHLRKSDINALIGLGKAQPKTPWQLYQLVDDQFVPMDFPRGVNWPTQVP